MKGSSTPAVAPLLVAMLLAVSCGSGKAPSSSPASLPQGEPAPEATPSTIPRRPVTLLLPSAGAEGLSPIEGEIFATASPVDQAKQVLGLLLEPRTPGTVVAPFPHGTTLRTVFIDARGTAFVSLSREATADAPGGSAWEVLAVHSLVGSLSGAVPQVKRVQLLVEGQEIETLAGHLDLRRPVTFDARLATPP